MKTKIIVDNKTIVSFTGSTITELFARAWLKKKQLEPKKFEIVNEDHNNNILSKSMFTMNEKFDIK